MDDCLTSSDCLLSERGVCGRCRRASGDASSFFRMPYHCCRSFVCILGRVATSCLAIVFFLKTTALTINRSAPKCILSFELLPAIHVTSFKRTVWNDRRELMSLFCVIFRMQKLIGVVELFLLSPHFFWQ